MPRTEVVRNFGEYRIVRCYIVVEVRSQSFHDPIQWQLRSGRSAPCCVLFVRLSVRHSGRTPLHLAASEVSEPAKTIELLLQPAAAAADIRQCTKAPQQGGVRAPSLRTARQFAALFPATMCFGVADSVDTSMIWLKWAVAPVQSRVDDRAGAHWQAVRKWLTHSHRSMVQHFCIIFAFVRVEQLNRSSVNLSSSVVWCQSLPPRFLSLEFGLRLEMQGSGGWPAECRSSTGRIWLVIHFAIVIEFGWV